MPTFNKKEWLDAHVASIHPSLSMYAFFWNGDPPKEVLVYLRASGEEAATLWPKAVKDLIDQGFRFDVLREIQRVQTEDGKQHLLFGGDGLPLFGKEMATVRLFRKEEDGIGLVLEVGAELEHLVAAEAVKVLYRSFDCDSLEVPQKYGTPFGAA